MPNEPNWIREAIKRLNERPCLCVSCAECRGTGNMAVNYDALGRFNPTAHSMTVLILRVVIGAAAEYRDVRALHGNGRVRTDA